MHYLVAKKQLWRFQPHYILLWYFFGHNFIKLQGSEYANVLMVNLGKTNLCRKDEINAALQIKVDEFMSDLYTTISYVKLCTSKIALIMVLS